MILVVVFSWVLCANAGELNVCADPNDLPFSNKKGQGFENKLAELVANQLGATLKYTWWAPRRGYTPRALMSAKCDLWPGVAVGVRLLESTRPYYRSSYVFVTRSDRDLRINSFDDPRLKKLRIGVQMNGADGAGSPPAYCLTRRGIINNVQPYLVRGDTSCSSPVRAIIDAVESKQVDIAVVWGPSAGYFAAIEPASLTLTPVQPSIDRLGLPMTFDIAMGVRRGNSALRQKIDQVLEQKRTEIDAILTQYHIPWYPLPTKEEPLLPGF
ncbi:MAG TPA: quinoprotein dehydrogenase-associated putative ABC transporter substrate-binding protein [Candidatus Binataceae bacterium]|nr:quinoprotein dehydrogenase-associated putative ABC transporter substrate-binding protein [Candidatus Binataceae bacterium]